MSTGRSNTSADKIQLLRYLKESLETASKLTFSETPEDVAIFIGTTKSGKSTLLNSLLGNPLIGQKEPKLRSITIVKGNNNLGPEIGRGPTSETIYPSRWISSEKLNGLVLWDSPGFEDNRGPVQDIINAYYVYRLFNNIKSAKIVLVTDVNDVLNDRINPFLSLLKSIENIFNDKLINCFSNIAVVFTKVPNNLDDEPVNVDLISEILDHQILSTNSIDMSLSTRNFIRHLTQNRNQIGLFKKASVGPIPNNVDAEIIQVIKSITGVQREILHSVTPSIADGSKVFLYKVRTELTSNNSFTELESSITAAFKEKLRKYKKIAKNEESQEILSLNKQELVQFKQIIQTVIDADINFHGKIKSLQKIDPIFNKKIEADNLTEKSKLMEFIDNVLGLKQTRIFDINLRSIIETTKSEVNEVIIELQVKLHEIDKKEAEERIKKIQEEEKERRRQAKEQRKNFEKENEETEKRFFTRFGESVGEAVDDFCDYMGELKDKFFKW